MLSSLFCITKYTILSDHLKCKFACDMFCNCVMLLISYISIFFYFFFAVLVF